MCEGFNSGERCSIVSFLDLQKPAGVGSLIMAKPSARVVAQTI